MQNKYFNWIVITLKESAWAPLAVFGFYVFGLFTRLYDLFPPLDVPTHFMGGVVITYFYRVAIRHAQKWVGEIPLPVQVVFAFTCTGTTTVFWEFYENFADRFLGTHMVRGLEDTIVDLILGVSGALVLSVLYRKVSAD
ncbi:MAG: hypothetical protein HXY42_05310 [Chloroflexi bacterium]|nr:hypothetical protein [Chloroflexota bacterium]